MVDKKGHVLTDNGLYLYTFDDLNYIAEQKIGSSTDGVETIEYDNLFNQGWSITQGVQSNLSPFMLLGGIPSYTNEDLPIPLLNNVQLNYSPKGNMLSISGSSSLMLLRLNDY
jgi:hypothetical protein